MYRVSFLPLNITVAVEPGKTLLEAAYYAQITLNSLCGGDGICGRCKMIVREGQVAGEVSPKLTREEIQQGYVLACLAFVQSDLIVEIPAATLAKEKVLADEDAERFRDVDQTLPLRANTAPAPLVTKVYLELEPPSLANNLADHQRVEEAIAKQTHNGSMQMGLKMIQTLPEILRNHDYRITATVGLRKDIAEVMNIEGGNTAEHNYMVVVDIGTTTVVAHLVNANTMATLDALACFNSQGMYGREVTGRIISAEKKGVAELQKLVVGDINQLIERLSSANHIHLRDITAVVCAGNTAMSHFLLGLCPRYIRRFPYVAVSVAPPPLRAAEVGIEINPRGLLYSLPGISGWVGSDLTAGILATQLHTQEQLSLLLDIGTNGEIIIGYKDWMVACSASAGPALEGAGIECGMRAERGAIERVYLEEGEIRYATIGQEPPKGTCGSGIIDLVSVLLQAGIINRSGKFVADEAAQVNAVDGIKRFLLADATVSAHQKPLYFSESDLENVMTAKAAIFAAMKILLERLDLQFPDIQHFYIAGAFGKHINIEHAITIGLIPDLPRERFQFVGNTSIQGAKLAAFYKEALQEIEQIRANTTYYDLMGANDYIEEFKKALFLPHTDIEMFNATRMNFK